MQKKSSQLYCDGASGEWSVGATYSTVKAPLGASVLFKYSKYHNVYQMSDSDAYESCSFTGAQELAGTDQGGGSGAYPNQYQFKCTTAGSFYLACQVGQHCRAGQKVGVTCGNVAPPVTEKKETISQGVQFTHLKVEDWAGDTKAVYEKGFGISLGIYNKDTQAWVAGASVTSKVTNLGRRQQGVAVEFTATVTETQASQAKTAAAQLAPATLVKNIQVAAQASGSNAVVIPTADVVRVSPPGASNPTVEKTSSEDSNSMSLILIIVCVGAVLILAIGAGLYCYCSGNCDRVASAPDGKYNNPGKGTRVHLDVGVSNQSGQAKQGQQKNKAPPKGAAKTKKTLR